MKARALLAVVSVGLLLVGCGRPSMKNGKIVFWQRVKTPNSRSMQHTVAMISPTGQQRSAVIIPKPATRWRSRNRMMMPIWSPKGKRLSLVAHRSLYITDAKGENPIRITRFNELAPEAKDFAWSPDGQWLAFVDNGLLRVVSADGQRGALIARNTTGRVYNVPMDWSADGRELFFFQHGVQGKFRLYAVKLKPSDFVDWSQVQRSMRVATVPQQRWRLLTGWRVGRYHGCRANPVGQQLACLLSGRDQKHQSGLPSPHVKVVSMQSGDVSSFLPDMVDELPKWSPDGKTVAFSAADGLWTVATHGWSHAVKVSKSAADFAWSPDGKWLAVVLKDRKSGIFKVRPDGQDWTLIAKPDGEVRSIDWQGLSPKNKI